MQEVVRKLLRALQPWEAHDRLLEELNLGQLLTVTGGGTWTTGPDTPRHNVLTTEFALRVAEYCDIATVLTGECSRLSALAGPPRFDDGWKTSPRAAADFAIVRTDGLRIAVEVTATTSKNLERRIESYAHMFANGSPGLVVVFLLAPSISPTTPRAAKLRRRVTRLIESAVRKYPGTSFASSANRFGVSSWDEWFPARGLVSECFLSLTAARPADVSHARGWSPAQFLDAVNVPTDHLDAGSATLSAVGWRRSVEMAKLRGSTPHWLGGRLNEEALLDLHQRILNGDFLDLRFAGPRTRPRCPGPRGRCCRCR